MNEDEREHWQMPVHTAILWTLVCVVLILFFVGLYNKQVQQAEWSQQIKPPAQSQTWFPHGAGK